MRVWLAPHCVRLTRRVRAYAVAVLGVFAALLVAAPAHASPTWLAPAALSPAGSVCGAPAAATDAAGDVTVAFGTVRWGSRSLAIRRVGLGLAWLASARWPIP
jgi:hypothetical protein